MKKFILLSKVFGITMMLFFLVSCTCRRQTKDLEQVLKLGERMYREGILPSGGTYGGVCVR